MVNLRTCRKLQDRQRLRAPGMSEARALRKQWLSEEDKPGLLGRWDRAKDEALQNGEVGGGPQEIRTAGSPAPPGRRGSQPAARAPQSTAGRWVHGTGNVLKARGLYV